MIYYYISKIIDWSMLKPLKPLSKFGKKIASYNKYINVIGKNILKNTF